MSPNVYGFLTTILLCPLAALAGGIVVILLAQDLLIGVLAGIAGLAAGLALGYVIAEYSMHRWPTEYDPVDEQTWERAQRRYAEPDKWPAPIETMFAYAWFMALFFGGTITALVVTLAVGWLLGG